MRLLALLAKSCVITSLITAAAGGTVVRGATYRVIDLGVLPGEAFSVAYGINDLDHVAGVSGSMGSFRAVIWKNGEAIDLGALPGGSSSIAWEINDLGQVAGEGDSHSVLRGFIWQNGVMTDLGDVPGGSRGISTRGINNRGQIVGEAVIPAGEGIPTAGVAFLWMNGEFTDLGSLSTRRSSIAFEINDVSQVVGQSQVGNSSRGFIWQNGVMTDLGDLPGGANFSNAYGINNLGQVVGRSDSSAGMRAFLCESGVMKPLGDVPGSTFVEAHSINDSSQVVGENEIDGVRRALLWESASSAPQYLEDLVDDSGALWSLEHAFAINNQGHIAGYGQFNGTTRAFLLVPEPATLILLSISALCVICSWRHLARRSTPPTSKCTRSRLVMMPTGRSELTTMMRWMRCLVLRERVKVEGCEIERLAGKLQRIARWFRAFCAPTRLDELCGLRFGARVRDGGTHDKAWRQSKRIPSRPRTTTSAAARSKPPRVRIPDR